MKTIIAGGRKTRLTLRDRERLDDLIITEVVSGGASGVDSDGEAYAKSRSIPFIVFKADWKSHGRAAGPIRNREMAKYADAVVLFPGGRGTDSMLREASRANIIVYDYR